MLSGYMSSNDHTQSTVKQAVLRGKPHLGADLRDGALALRGVSGAHQGLHVHGRTVPVQSADVGDAAPPGRHPALPYVIH